MNARKYEKCVNCGRTIDVTNQDRELCDVCANRMKDTSVNAELSTQLVGAVEALIESKTFDGLNTRDVIAVLECVKRRYVDIAVSMEVQE